MDVNGIKKRFLSLNNERLQRTRASLRASQQDVLDVLPLLFHVNHPSLPGYVSAHTPAGVANYYKEGQAIQAAQRLIRGFELRRAIRSSYDIQALFLIGSSGTIAHSTASDFDVWLCHASDLTDEQLWELRKKGELIEKWADSHNLEMHFFLMDAQRFKRGEVLDLSSESSGTAQHDLLLDEFYRTALWLAGSYPMWWLVPPEQEVDYDEYVENLLQKRYVQASDVIDFGGLGRMPAEEFFGAAVWQIYKGVDSPYKSVLKILLMEIYVSEYPKVQFLSLRYKRAVYEEYDDEFELDRVDPYIMLINKLSEYLEFERAYERLDLVRRCFYFKVNMPLSKMRYQKGANWQQDRMKQLIKEWGWRFDYLCSLDGRNDWKIDKITRERTLLVKELTQSYFVLSEFARHHSGLEKMISEQDLNVLGRKLYAAFERKAGKLDIINRGFSADLHEPLVALQQRVVSGGRESWYLFRGDGLQNEETSLPFKRSPSVMESLCWAYFNRLIDKRSSYVIRQQTSELSDREIVSIIRTLQDHFPQGRLPKAGIGDFAEKPKLLSVMLFVNVGTTTSAAGRGMGHLITDASDALRYGASGVNLIQYIDAVYVTSWQEVLTFHYQGEQGLMDCMAHYLQWSPLNERKAPPRVQVYCYSSGYHEKITQRLNRLFNNAATAYYRKFAASANLRYIIAVRQGFAMLHAEDGVIKHRAMESLDQLMTMLGEPRNRYSGVFIDPDAKLGLLSAIYEYDKPGVIQFYFHVVDKHLDLYVLDEKGALFTQSLLLADPKRILQHYYTFLTAIVKRQAATLENDIDDQSKVICYQLISRGKGAPLVEQRDISFSMPNQYFNVQVIGEGSDGSDDFSVYCNDREFATVEYGDRIFEKVAEYILAQRQSGQAYPIYITDIDLPGQLLEVAGEARLQTLHYLNYKCKVERKLNQVMNRLQLPA